MSYDLSEIAAKSSFPLAGVIYGADDSNVTPPSPYSGQAFLDFIAASLLRPPGSKGDDTANDSAAIIAAASPCYLPKGKYRAPSIATPIDITGKFWGEGQIRTADGNLSAPWYSHISAQPARSGGAWLGQDFNGDLSGVQIAMAHVVTGAATAGTPATGYDVVKEISPILIEGYFESGHNESTSGNDGRTGAALLNLSTANAGQGDYGAEYISAIVTSTRAGSTSVLANPGVSWAYGSIFGAVAGAYIQLTEFDFEDFGFDVAAIGHNVVSNRTNDTGDKQAWWNPFRSQSIGTKRIDVGYIAVGGHNYAFDASHADLGTNQAAFTLSANQRIYFDATIDSSGISRRPDAPGSVFITYNSTNSALELAASKGFGYSAGMGGTVTQSTSKSTAVTLNKPTGEITLNAASLAANTSVTFTLTNNTIASTDVLHINHSSGGTPGAYTVSPQCGNGSATITLRNVTAGALAEAVVLRFVLLKGKTS
jgi:hypothetical protein